MATEVFVAIFAEDLFETMQRTAVMDHRAVTLKVLKIELKQSLENLPSPLFAKEG